MYIGSELKQLKSDLTAVWIVYAAMCVTPVIYIAIFGSMERIVDIAVEQPIMLRSILYFVVIAAFPLINLLRHIMLRLNQTMPGEVPARSRYLTTVLVSLVLSEAIAILGLLLYFLGDEFNTLLIFCLLSLLAMFLYRPKLEEYTEIVTKLQQRADSR